MSQEELEDRLMEVENEALGSGVSRDAIISAFELRLMALREDDED